MSINYENCYPRLPVSTSVLEMCSLTIDTAISISITHSYCTSLVCVL